MVDATRAGRRHAEAGALALGVLLAGAVGEGASAAVRVCEPSVRGAPAEAASEVAARRAALRSWMEKAREYGAGYDSWRLAANRTMGCRATGSGNVRCEALASPCIVRQVPPREPPPPPPLPRRRPPPAGGIEI